mmetsp:Transcript_151145/g.485555  ORF Transcript_151145/g.485555 Transcript_151145/m.485555 type:complete len:216 (-) Transcript_151145:101-748(-)
MRGIFDDAGIVAGARAAQVLLGAAPYRLRNRPIYFPVVEAHPAVEGFRRRRLSRRRAHLCRRGRRRCRCRRRRRCRCRCRRRRRRRHRWRRRCQWRRRCRLRHRDRSRERLEGPRRRLPGAAPALFFAAPHLLPEGPCSTPIIVTSLTINISRHASPLLFGTAPGLLVNRPVVLPRGVVDAAVVRLQERRRLRNVLPAGTRRRDCQECDNRAASP